MSLFFKFCISKRSSIPTFLHGQSLLFSHFIYFFMEGHLEAKRSCLEANSTIKLLNCYVLSSARTVYVLAVLSKACFTSIVQQQYICLRRQISGFRVAVLRCCMQHRKAALLNHRVARLPQWQKLNFQHVHFPCDSLAILRGTKSCCMARKAFVPLT